MCDIGSLLLSRFCWAGRAQIRAGRHIRTLSIICIYAQMRFCWVVREQGCAYALADHMQVPGVYQNLAEDNSPGA